jgi:DNA-binding NarL/FixJ family response regulator
VLADDHEDILIELTALLETEFDVVGVAHDGITLVSIASHLKPDVVITDYKMPGLSGIDASSILLERAFCKVVVLLTMYCDRQLAGNALRSGIRAFVLKVKAGEDLIPAIHSALRGETFVSSFEPDGV